MAKEVFRTKQLAADMAEKFNIAKKESEEMIAFVVEEVKDAMKKGKVADVANLGRFEIAERAARVGVNPATGEKIQIAASKKIKFKPCKALKEEVK